MKDFSQHFFDQRCFRFWKCLVGCHLVNWGIFFYRKSVSLALRCAVVRDWGPVGFPLGKEPAGGSIVADF
jgi:hypothetical protein